MAGVGELFIGDSPKREEVQLAARRAAKGRPSTMSKTSRMMLGAPLLFRGVAARWRAALRYLLVWTTPDRHRNVPE